MSKSIICIFSAVIHMKDHIFLYFLNLPITSKSSFHMDKLDYTQVFSILLPVPHITIKSDHTVSVQQQMIKEILLIYLAEKFLKYENKKGSQLNCVASSQKNNSETGLKCTLSCTLQEFLQNF